MPKLTHPNDTITIDQINCKLAQLYSGHLTREKANQIYEEIKALYIKMRGDPLKWDASLKKCVDDIKNNVLNFYADNRMYEINQQIEK